MKEISFHNFNAESAKFNLLYEFSTITFFDTCEINKKILNLNKRNVVPDVRFLSLFQKS